MQGVKVLNMRDVASETWEELFRESFPIAVPPMFPEDLLIIWGEERAVWGWVVVTPSGQDLYVGWGAVRPEHRAQGRAAAGVGILMEVAGNLGYRNVMWVTERKNTRMQRVALKCGFLIHGITTGRDGYPEVIFLRQVGG